MCGCVCDRVQPSVVLELALESTATGRACPIANAHDVSEGASEGSIEGADERDGWKRFAVPCPCAEREELGDAVGEGRDVAISDGAAVPLFKGMAICDQL